MINRKIAVAGLVAASVLFAACGDDEETAPTTTAAPATTVAAAPETSAAAMGTIVDVASSNPDFATLVAAVSAAGLVETLSGPGPFTVFAPTNAAFDALPAGVLDKLLLPENVDVLTQILTYHVLGAQVLAADVAAGDVATVQGENITISTDGGVKVNAANVTATDVMASNGVIHVIDAVILPPSLDLSTL
jgi:uncharacterized surface protein with fasciclin (FAS1) repeats